MKLAVISYPYHYHITQLAIKHAIDNIEDITDVYVIWDDKTLPIPHSNYIPFSQIYDFPDKLSGWYRQQIIKLNLHKVLTGEVLILDGDVILNHTLNPKQYFYAPGLGEDTSTFLKVKELLHIDQFDFSCAPFMYVQSKWLQELQDLNPTINQLYINTARSSWSANGLWPIPEWNLLYHFITEVKKINKQVLPLEYELLKTISFEENFNNTQNFVLDGKDNFTINFYEKHKIKINETLWKQIYGALV